MAEVQLQVGQVWEDNDPRMYGRRFMIVALNPDTKKAKVEGLLGRRTYISYQRLQMNNNRGYRLVQ